MDETYDVAVVGAGLAGLAAAATAAGAGTGRSVLVLDSKGGGGRAATDQVGRFRFNRGAHAFYPADIEPDEAEEVRYLHRMVACAALPVAAAGGMQGRPGVDTGIDGVLVAGDWVGPVGHIADAALASGEAAGRAAVEGLERDPLTRAIA